LDKKLSFILLVGIFALISYLYFVAKESMDSPFDDFGHYWITSNLLQDGHNVWAWDKNTQNDYIRIAKEHNITIIVPPFQSSGFFVLVRPIMTLPFFHSVYLALFIGNILLFYSIWLLMRICKSKLTLEDVAMASFLIFSFWPLREQVHQMQPNFLSLFFLILSLFLIKNKRMLLAGLFLGLAIQTREYLGVMALLLIYKKNWKAIAGVAISFILLKGIAISLFGIKCEISYWAHIYETFGRQIHLSINNYSFAAAVCRFTEPYLARSVSNILVILGLLLFLATALSWIRKSKGDVLLEYALFVLLSFLVCPWIHNHHLVVLYIPVLIIWFKLSDNGSLKLYWLFIAAYLLMGIGYSFVRFPGFHLGLLSIFSAGQLIGILIMFFILGKLLTNERIAA